MGSLVVLQCHLWLTLTEMRDMDKSPLLDAHVNPQGLFGDAVGAFSEKFSEQQKPIKMMMQFLPKQADAQARSRQRCLTGKLPECVGRPPSSLRVGYQYHKEQIYTSVCSLTMTEVSEQSAPLLRAEIHSLLAKQADSVLRRHDLAQTRMLSPLTPLFLSP